MCLLSPVLEYVESLLYPFTFHQTDISNISLSTSFQSGVKAHILQVIRDSTLQFVPSYVSSWYIFLLIPLIETDETA